MAAPASGGRVVDAGGLCQNSIGDMMRIKMIIEYDGTEFYGFQRQPNVRTVDRVLEEAVLKLTGEMVRIVGAGRTDAGVHALGQVVAFDTGSGIPPEKFARALNTCLPEDIKAVSSVQASAGFHPAFDSTRKTYRYLIYRSWEGYTLYRRFGFHYTGPLDVGRMQEAAALIVGEHDFRGFMASGSDAKTTVRNVFEFTVAENHPWLTFEVTGSGFLYHMVRNLVGTLVEIGRGAMNIDTLQEILKNGDRSLAGPTAPAKGLCLLRVFY